MMEKMEIGNEIAKSVSMIIGEPVTCTKIVRNNGVEKVGIQRFPRLMDDGMIHAAPIFDLEAAIRRIESGEVEVDDVAEMIAGVITETAEISKNLDRETIMDSCRIKVLSARKNARMFAGKPFRRVCDLAELVVFQTEISGRECFATVDNRMMEMFGISEEELFEAARRNTEREMVLKNMNELFDTATEQDIYVLTNNNGMFGAGILGCPEALKKCMEMTGGDCYIIPSSVHEVLLIRKEETDAMGVVEIIRSVNSSEVIGDEEYLSDLLYEVDSNGTLLVAAM